MDVENQRILASSSTANVRADSVVNLLDFMTKASVKLFIKLRQQLASEQRIKEQILEVVIKSGYRFRTSRKDGKFGILG